MKAREVRDALGVTQMTIHNYVARGVLHPTVVNERHYEYDRDEVLALVGKRKNQPVSAVTYGRVSLPKQKADLQSQNSRLYDFALRNGYELSEQISDIKSGMEFKKRKGFSHLVDLVMEGRVSTVIVENKDRLARFGFELIENLFNRFGTEIVVMSDTPNKSYEQELTDDLVSIIHHYSMKASSNRRRLNKAEKALKEPEE